MNEEGYELMSFEFWAMPLVKVYGATYEHSLGESLSDLVCADFGATRKVLVVIFMPNP